MPPQQSNRPLDVFDQLFGFGAHVEMFLGQTDLATAHQRRNRYVFRHAPETQSCRRRATAGSDQ
jgi:hypothetical protein